MYMPFASAADKVADHQQPIVTYQDRVEKIKDSLPGYEKAKHILDLLNTMQKDKIDFYGLFQKAPSPELQTELCSSRPMLAITQDPVDGVYFYPNATGQTIEAGCNKDVADHAWYESLHKVTQWALSGVYSKGLSFQQK